MVFSPVYFNVAFTNVVGRDYYKNKEMKNNYTIYNYTIPIQQIFMIQLICVVVSMVSRRVGWDFGLGKYFSLISTKKEQRNLFSTVKQIEF